VDEEHELDSEGTAPDTVPEPQSDTEQNVSPQQYEALRRSYAASSREGKRLARELKDREVVLNGVLDLLTPEKIARLAEPEEEFTRQDIPQRDTSGQRLNGNGYASGNGERPPEPWEQKPEIDDDYARLRYGSWPQSKHHVERFLSRPETRAAYDEIAASDPHAALDWAIERLNTQHRLATASRILQARDRTEAMIPSTRSGDARHVPGPKSEVEMARERMNRAPTQANKEAWARKVIGASMPYLDDHIAGRLLRPGD